MPIGEPTTFRRPNDTGVRNTQERICLIVNPRAGAGRAGAQIDKLKQLTDRAFEQWEIRTTQAPGHAAELARAAAEEGFDLVAAVGGDGTCHEVVNGLFNGTRAVRTKTAFTVIPFGTGSDLVRSLEIPTRTADALWIAATGITLPTDVGHATFTTEQGENEEVFINMSGFGANGDAVRRSNRSSKRFGGKVTFISASLQTLLLYKPGAVRVTFEGEDSPPPFEGTLLSTFIGNGHYCGGGMWVGKGGSMQDGNFDVTMLQPTGLIDQMVDFRRLYDGSLEKAAGVRQVRCSSLTAESMDGQSVPVELDGEERGHLPMKVKALPRALHVRGGWTQNPLDPKGS